MECFYSVDTVTIANILHELMIIRLDYSIVGAQFITFQSDYKFNNGVCVYIHSDFI